jgi:hypothetical protein
MFKVGRAVVDAWSLCARRLGLSKDMRLYVAGIVWTTHKYDGTLSMRHHPNWSADFVIMAGNVAQFVTRERQFPSTPTNEIEFQLNAMFRFTVLMSKFGVYLNGVFGSRKETLDALKSILYKTPMPSHGLVMIDHRTCGCTYVQKELYTFGDAMEFMGCTHPDSGVLVMVYIPVFGRMMYHTGNGPFCASHVMLYPDCNKRYFTCRVER